MERSLETQVDQAVESWLRWLPRWEPATHRGRVAPCRRCLGSPVLSAAGLRVPGDIAIIGFDDSPVATSLAPALTTMRQPSRRQGEVMADVLLERLAGRPAERVTIMHTELVVRDSA